MGVLVVITTVPDENLAVKIADQLLQEGLAACVHALPAGRSRYRWQGRIETATELTLMIKTTTARYPEVENAIVAAHPYKVPEVIALPVIGGLGPYLDWIGDETR